MHGDILEVRPAYEETAIRVEFWGNEVERITRFDPPTSEVAGELSEVWMIYPATHYVASQDRMQQAIASIERELEERPA